MGNTHLLNIAQSICGAVKVCPDAGVERRFKRQPACLPHTMLPRKDMQGERKQSLQNMA